MAEARRGQWTDQQLAAKAVELAESILKQSNAGMRGKEKRQAQQMERMMNDPAGKAFTLALAIAIQNVPEGAIVALPLRTAGAGKGRAFLGGVLSGVVEPLAAGVTVLAAALIVPALPWLLGFAAGAMLYVVAAELLPTRGDSGPGALAFAAGFTVMMILDVALG